MNLLDLLDDEPSARAIEAADIRQGVPQFAARLGILEIAPMVGLPEVGDDPTPPQAARLVAAVLEVPEVWAAYAPAAGLTPEPAGPRVWESLARWAVPGSRWAQVPTLARRAIEANWHSGRVVIEAALITYERCTSSPAGFWQAVALGEAKAAVAGFEAEARLWAARRDG